MHMWKRDQAAKSANGQPGTAADIHQQPATPIESAIPGAYSQRDQIDIVNIGKSVVMKGELSGSEDVTVEGQLEGAIELRENVLTIGLSGTIRAQVFAKAVIVFGAVHGDITASDKVEIRASGAVDGDIVSPRVAIADGARFCGSVDMQTRALSS